MTLITFQDGKPVLRDGKIGTEQDCCCQQDTCPSECIEGLLISLGNSPLCSPFGVVVYLDTVFLDGPCGTVQASVSMRCTNGVWTAVYTLCGFNCDATYEAVLDLDNDGLPIAGEIAWTYVGGQSNDCCPDPIPTVTVLR